MKRILQVVVCLAGLMGSFTASRAQAAMITVDFESFTPMSNSPGSPVPPASQLSNQLLSSQGMVFSSGTSFVSVVDLGSNHATSGTHGIGGSTPTGALSYSHAIDVRFFLPAEPATAAVTDFVSIRSDLVPVGGDVTLQAFDINGVLLGSDVKADSLTPTLSVSAAGIHHARFFSQSNTVAFDDLVFSTPLQAATAAVPEPSSIAMLGLTAAVICIRRRRSTL